MIYNTLFLHTTTLAEKWDLETVWFTHGPDTSYLNSRANLFQPNLAQSRRIHFNHTISK